MGSSRNCTLKPLNSFKRRKTVFEMVTSMGILHAKAPNPSRRRQIRNEELRTELEYFIEDHEMEPRLERTMEVTPPLHTRSPKVCRQREMVVEFEKASNMKGSGTGRNTEGNRPSKARAEENGRREMNPPTFGSPLRKERK
ncbi:hypothetical protein Tco_0070883 [Tanacetum coccineum]